MLKIRDGKKVYIVLGAGGTGSWLSSMLSKIDVETILIDGDIVEPKNVSRQNFQKKDVGLNKAETLANQFGFGYVSEFITGTELLESIIDEYENVIPVIVGCLDNNATRKIAHDLFHLTKYKDIIWVDSGNAERSGQTYVAAKVDGEIKYKSPLEIDDVFKNFEGDERRPDQISCAEQSESAPQNVTANVMAATVLFNVLNIINTGGLLLANKFAWDTRSNQLTASNVK